MSGFSATIGTDATPFFALCHPPRLSRRVVLLQISLAKVPEPLRCSSHRLLPVHNCFPTGHTYPVNPLLCLLIHDRPARASLGFFRSQFVPSYSVSPFPNLPLHLRPLLPGVQTKCPSALVLHSIPAALYLTDFIGLAKWLGLTILCCRCLLQVVLARQWSPTPFPISLLVHSTRPHAEDTRGARRPSPALPAFERTTFSDAGLAVAPVLPDPPFLT